jgi:nucleoside-diphosphate-sugar epimerase
MPRRAPDISKIQQLIGYQPVLDLPEMLERVIAYEREWGE